MVWKLWIATISDFLLSPTIMTFLHFSTLKNQDEICIVVYIPVYIEPNASVDNRQELGGGWVLTFQMA